VHPENIILLSSIVNPENIALLHCTMHPENIILLLTNVNSTTQFKMKFVNS
jgi:hypothetical protein